MSKTLDEIHKIREKIYKEEKGLSNKEALDKLHERVGKIIKARNLKLNRVETRVVGAGRE